MPAHRPTWLWQTDYRSLRPHARRGRFPLGRDARRQIACSTPSTGACAGYGYLRQTETTRHSRSPCARRCRGGDCACSPTASCPSIDTWCHGRGRMAIWRPSRSGSASRTRGAGRRIAKSWGPQPGPDGPSPAWAWSPRCAPTADRDRRRRRAFKRTCPVFFAINEPVPFPSASSSPFPEIGDCPYFPYFPACTSSRPSMRRSHRRA